MKKVSLILLSVLTLALLVNLTAVEASPAALASEADVQHVGLVVAYTADESITIVDRDGNQYTFTLAPNLKIVPPHRADLLGVGAYVTIIAPNNVPNGKQIATGIVIHPKPPSSFPIPTASATPLPTETLVLPTDTVLPTELPSETPTEVPTDTATSTEVPSETPTVTETFTETPTNAETATETMTATATETSTPEVPTSALTVSTSQDTQSLVKSFVEWLAGLFRQFVVAGN